MIWQNRIDLYIVLQDRILLFELHSGKLNQTFIISFNSISNVFYLYRATSVGLSSTPHQYTYVAELSVPWANLKSLISYSKYYIYNNYYLNTYSTPQRYIYIRPGCIYFQTKSQKIRTVHYFFWKYPPLFSMSWFDRGSTWDLITFASISRCSGKCDHNTLTMH